MKHTLSAYTALLEERGLLAAPLSETLDRSAPVELVSYDSREVAPGTLFLCKGAHFKAEFLSMAQSKGAAAYVSETPYPEVNLPCIQVSDMRLAIAPLADLFYGHPSGQVKVVALTGTKGKSTAAYYMKYILDEYQREQNRPECGILSTITTYDGLERFESHITTPEPLELQRHLAHAVQAGMDYVVMEASSQALKYHRTLCTDFAAAAFLNIGLDHISPIEHPDFEDYFSSKLRIFAQGAVNCVNLDCDHAGRVLEAARAAGRPVITYSQKDQSAGVYAFQVRKRGGDLLFRVRTRAFQREFRLTMPGLFNVENALAAIALCQGLGIPQRCVYAGLERAKVPGRMEVYSNASGEVTAIVDFAHNRMSFENLCRSARAEYPGRRVVSVFGSVGSKAQERRKDLGEVGGRYSDLVIATEDDSEGEETLDICREIAAYVEKEGCPCAIQPNRGEAIRQAILGCREPTVLLVAGKGDETYQKRGDEYVATPTDAEYVQSFLGEYDMVHGLDGAEKVRGLLAALPLLGRYAGKRVEACCAAVARSDLLQDVSALRAVGIRAQIREGGAPAQPSDFLIFLSQEVGGRTALDRMDVSRAEELLSAGQLAGPLAGTVRRCLHALQEGSEEAAVLDGGTEHALLLHFLDQPVGGLSITK